MDLKRLTAHIDLDALDKNFDNIQAKVSKDITVVGVIKADGYGHGAVEVARELMDRGVEWLAAATIDEAIELRDNGITCRIIILSPVHRDYYHLLLEYDITPAVFSYENAKLLNELALKAGKKFKIHIAVDTGMTRIGFRVNEENADEVKKINELQSLEIEGMFTHFSCADMEDRDYTDMQFDKFNVMINLLEERGIHIPLRHAGNSAAIMRFPEMYINMVRAGVILYGMMPSDEVDPSLLEIEPVMSVKSYIAYLKTVPAGVCVSYGATFTTDRETKIATVPVGYADGYPRKMSNQGRVIIRGRYARILGRVCMDQMMVDVTDIPGVQENDEVTVMGRDGDAVIYAEEIADYAETINYEITCGISKRVPRVYFRGDQVVDITGYYK